MSNFAELFLVLGLMAVGAVYFLFQRLRGRFHKAKLKDCDFLVFEAYPGHLPPLQADLAIHAWNLVDSEPTSSGAVLYRFEKADDSSTPLSDIFNFERSMPRTANRHMHAHLPVKIHSYGSARNANAEA